MWNTTQAAEGRKVSVHRIIIRMYLQALEMEDRRKARAILNLLAVVPDRIGEN